LSATATSEITSVTFETLKSLPGLAALAVDRTLCIDDATPDAESAFGVARMDLAGLPLLHFVDDGDREQATRTLDTALNRHGATATFQIALGAVGTPSGRRLFNASASRPTDTGGGEGDGLIVVLHDVTEIDRTARQLREVVEGSIQGIIVHRGGPPLFANDALAQMLGMESRALVLGETSITPYIHPDDLDMVAGNVAARLRGEDAPSTYEFRLKSADGRTVWVECRATTLTWDDEPAVLATLYDITNRMTAEAEQRKSETLFATVFQTSPEIITITRLENGHYIDINNGFLKTLGYERDEVIGRSATELGVWLDPGFRDELVAEISKKGSIRDKESRIRCKDGTVKDILFSAETFRFGEDQILLFVGHDTTSRKQHERELRESKTAAELANRAKGEFLANMSHELRTPLNAIIGFAEVLQQEMFGPLGSAKYAEYAADIHSSGAHLLDIINDILDLSKLESGRYELHESEFTVADLTRTCVRFIRERAREAGLAVRMDLPESILNVTADRRLMKQIMLNLLSNAVKFTPNGGTVTIGARLTDAGDCALYVSDTGVGMSQDGIETALMPFGQVASALSRDHEGTGLGIPLARSLVERHGGAFNIQSAPGEGTTVTITVPAERVSIQAEAMAGE
jgi:PAS domain S-box-containing protein